MKRHPRKCEMEFGSGLRVLAFGRNIAAAGILLSTPCYQAAAASESKSFVVSWFLQATNSYDGDCADGINQYPADMTETELKGLGWTPQEIEKVMKGYQGGASTPATREALVMRGRVDGKPVNVYTYPTSVPDIGFHQVTGKYALGFNLDGRVEPNSFEDPESHEKGVDNQYWRALGCHPNHRAAVGDRAGWWEFAWEVLRDKLPAFVITITGDDLSKDGDVTVTMKQALDRAWRDANGNIRADTTFRIDPDPRWENKPMRGTMKDGVITAKSDEVHLLGDPMIIMHLDWYNAHVRIKLNPDGTLKGIIGGYMPWKNIYFMHSGAGYNAEGMQGTNVPGAYYALRKAADAFPDPETGKNTAISTAFSFDAVPAFVASTTASK